MKVLFVGLGSAGQRHLRNLKRILGDDVEVMAYRVRGLQRMFDDKMNIVEGKNLDEEMNITVYKDYAEALKEEPDIVFITNQNSKHLKYAIPAARVGCNLFIEKPISHTLDGISELKEIVKQNNNIVYIGYQNRLHPCVKHARELIKSGELGNIHMVYSELGEYLPRMHPWEDYTKMHEANASLGGGVIICQLHELDYIYYLFGMPDTLFAVGGKTSDMKIDVEDSCTVLAKYKNKDVDMAVNIHLDFIQSPPTRHCKISGDKGRFEFDLIKNTGVLYKHDGSSKRFENDGFERNDMFIEELNCFLNDIETGKSSLDLDEGIKSIEFAMAIKKSLRTSDLVYV